MMNTRISIVTCCLTFILLISQRLYAQDPAVQWENTIGGGNNDYLMASDETLDGGFILGGYSVSTPSYDKTEYVGANDYWIVKLNSIGAIEWETTIGTTVADYLTSIISTPDGGYLVGGYTTGGISADKTDPAIGLTDYWIIKLAPTGDIVWQKTIGGTGNDFLNTMMALPGGGFILSGTSNSGISGNKTEACMGGNDYWLIKINSVGDIIWQHTIGGSINDYLMETIRTTDGNYVLAGYSDSGISGDKSEACLGGYDYWVVEIDGSGDIVWQNTLGGANYDYLTAVCELNTGGFILGGYSYSNASKDKSENSLNYSDWCWGCGGVYLENNGTDYWIIRIDEAGNVIWENTYITGGEYSKAEVNNVFQYADNKIMVAGNAESGYENLDTNDGNNYWLLTIDTNGYIIRQQVLRGENSYADDEYDTYVVNGDNYLRSCLVTSDGGFFIAGSSNGLAGNDKSETCHGQDYWVLKLGADTCLPSPIFSDFDSDGAGENFLANTCEYSAGPWVTNSDDCNDLFNSVNPSALEICDNLDNDCDGLIDEDLIDCNSGPEIIYDKTLGDENLNGLSDSYPTSDGGIILSGTNTVVTVIPGPTESVDYFYQIEIAKLDAYGNLQLKKLITAEGYEHNPNIVQTNDGGYLIGATSSSGISGDKTVASFGSSDYWLIKLNEGGEIEWQKVYGGSSYETFYDIKLTPDNGIILSGTSSSGISGNKTENSVGSSDYWVLKLNAIGEIQWQNNIGGNSDESRPKIALDSIGNIYVGGYSSSGISGDKTEINYGSYDYWVLKLDTLGEIVWQNTLKGTSSDAISDVVVTPGGQMIIAGYSNSAASSDKSETSTNNDFWIVKLKTNGTIDWENTIIGSGNDYCTTIELTADGGCLIGGYSSSLATLDKIEPFNNSWFNFYGIGIYEKYDYWVLKLDSLGNIIWQNTLGGNMSDFLSSIIIGVDEKIYLCGSSNSSISGDKTEKVHGTILETIQEEIWGEDTFYNPDSDWWIIQLQPDDCTLIDELCNTIDDNCNGLIDDEVIETISITAVGPTEFCQGSSVSLTATYTGISLQWQKNGSNIPGATSASYTATTKGNYTCITTSDCGTATSDAIFVNVFKNPKAIVSAAGPTTFCSGGSVTLNVSPVAGCSYQWYKDALPIPGATTTNYLATTAGIYKCRVTKIVTGCFKTSAGITVSVPCKEGELIEPQNTFSINPNPNNGTFTISAHSAISAPPRETNTKTKLIILNTTGQQIFNMELDSQQSIFEINIPEIPTGMYVVKLISGANIYEQKLIIE